MHFPPWTATLLQSGNSHRLRAGPWALHNPLFLTCLVHPATRHTFRLAPCCMHNPPCTTLFSQLGMLHLRLDRDLGCFLEGSSHDMGGEVVDWGVCFDEDEAGGWFVVKAAWIAPVKDDILRWCFGLGCVSLGGSGFGWNGGGGWRGGAGGGLSQLG